MTASTETDGPGIIRLESGSQVRSTHFRAELFEDGPLQINTGSLTLSDGFAGTLADALDDGLDYSFDIGSTAEMQIVDSFDNIKRLAVSLEKSGKSARHLFGDGTLEITLRDTPENIQAAFNAPQFGLGANVTNIELDADPGAPPFRVPVDALAQGISFSGVTDIEVVGTFDDYLRVGTAILPLDDETFTFVVEDSISGFFDFDAIYGGEEFSPVGFIGTNGYRIVDSVANIQPTAFDLSETSFHGLAEIYGAVGSVANLVNAIDTFTLPTTVQSIILEDTVSNLAVASTSLPVDDARITGVRAIDIIANLKDSSFDQGYLPEITELIARDIADAVADEIGADPEGPITFGDGVPVSAIEILSGSADPLRLSLEDITALELNGVTVEQAGDLKLSVSTDQLDSLGFAADLSESALSRIEPSDNAELFAAGTSTEIEAALENLALYNSDLLDLFTGFDLLSDGSTFESLFLSAEFFSQDGEANSLIGLFDEPLIFNALDSSTFIGVTGDAVTVQDENFVPGSYLNQDGNALGITNLFVDDTAAALRDQAGALDALNDGDSSFFTIQDIPVQFTHFVGYDDVASAGADGIEFTGDDIPAPALASFDGASDQYVLDSEVVTEGAAITIGGSFDVSAQSRDFINLSSLPGFSDPQEFTTAWAFVAPDALGDRTLPFFAPADIAVGTDGASGTLIEFDGFGAGANDPYDGTPGLTITIPDVDLTGSIQLETDPRDAGVSNGFTQVNLSGLFGPSFISYNDIDDSTNIPDIDLLRSSGYFALGSALQTFSHYQAALGDTLDIRQGRVLDTVNIEGAIEIGDGYVVSTDQSTTGPTADSLFGDTAAELGVDDVLFGLGGDDELYGLTGDDYLSGGDGNDELYGSVGNDELWGDYGDDALFGGDNDDLLYGGIGSDELDGGDGADQLFGQYGSDTIYAGDGNDVASGGDDDDTIYGGFDDDILNGGAGNDTLYGEYGFDALYGDSGQDRLFGGIDNDALYGGSGDDELYGESGDDALYGEYGFDTLAGGGGNDWLDGGTGIDTADFSNATAAVTVDLALSMDQAVGQGTDQLISIENVTGGDFNDILKGDAIANHLSGGDGVDMLYGMDGNDRISGGDGKDVLSGGAGQDVFSFAAKSEFGDSITDFTKGFTGDIIELSRNALAADARLSNASLDGSVLVEEDLFFALASSGPVGPYGSLNGFGTYGDIKSLQPDDTLTAATLPVFTSINSDDLRITVEEEDFASAFKSALVGAYAPTQINGYEAANPATFTETVNGQSVLVTAPTTTFFPAAFEGKYVAMGLVSKAVGGETSSAALVMAFINNGALGNTTIGGLNEITANEVISVVTIAQFGTSLGADALTMVDPFVSGEILLV